MRGLLAPLSPHEEAALRKIGFGGADHLAATHLRRLLDLDLIEWGGSAWMLTLLGQQRYAALAAETARPSAA